MSDKIFQKLKSLNKDKSDKEILLLLNSKIYLCPGNYEFSSKEERKKRIKERDENYKKFVEEQTKLERKYKKD